MLWSWDLKPTAFQKNNGMTHQSQNVLKKEMFQLHIPYYHRN